VNHFKYVSQSTASRHLRPVESDDPDDPALLVERVRAGDERAFTTLYHAHAGYLAGVAYRILGDASELDDVVQETFVAAKLGIQQLKEPEAVRFWLVTIAVRNVKRRLAARIRRRELSQEVARSSVSAGDTREAGAVRELYDVLDRLSPKLRVPWMLARIEGHALAEVASICGLSLATIKRRVARAEQFVQRRLDAG
jgi:RNA polymerase sigma-70 factor (ECF subfamily)